MSQTTIPTDLNVQGNFYAKAMTLPAGAVGDSQVAAGAGISATKLVHRHLKVYSQAAGSDATAETRIVHVARKAGTVQEFVVGLVAAPDTASGSGGKTATVDLKKNGTSILTGSVTLDSTATAYGVSAGTISTASIAEDDVLTVAVALGAGSTGTAPQGVFAEVTIDENSI